MGNLFFLKCANTKSPTSNCTSLLFKYALCLYFWLLSYSYFLTYSCNYCIAIAKSLASTLLISTFPKFVNSQIPLGCIPNTIWNGLNPRILLGESLCENLALVSGWFHCFECSLTILLKMFPKLLLINLAYPSIQGW